MSEFLSDYPLVIDVAGFRAALAVTCIRDVCSIKRDTVVYRTGLAPGCCEQLRPLRRTKQSRPKAAAFPIAARIKPSATRVHGPCGGRLKSQRP
jgi:hypothetical protein